MARKAHKEHFRKPASETALADHNNERKRRRNNKIQRFFGISGAAKWIWHVQLLCEGGNELVRAPACRRISESRRLQEPPARHLGKRGFNGKNAYWITKASDGRQ